MRTPLFLSATLVSGALLSAALTAWAADVFDFIPLGGRSHLAQRAGRPPGGRVRAVVGAKHTGQEWAAYLRSHERAFPAIAN